MVSSAQTSDVRDGFMCILTESTPDCPSGECGLTTKAQRRRAENRPARKRKPPRRWLERMVRRRGPHKIQAFEKDRLSSESVKRACDLGQSTWRSKGRTS